MAKNNLSDLTIKVAPDATIKMHWEGSEGLTRWLDRLDHFRGAAEDMRPAFQTFGRYMMRSIERNFAAEGRPKRWKALAESTVKDRKRKGYGARHPILVRRGDLKRGFSFDAKMKYFRIHNDLPFFKYHQEGGEHLPQRMMVVMQSQDKAQFTKAYRRHLGFYK